MHGRAGLSIHPGNFQGFMQTCTERRVRGGPTPSALAQDRKGAIYTVRGTSAWNLPTESATTGIIDHGQYSEPTNPVIPIPLASVRSAWGLIFLFTKPASSQGRQSRSIPPASCQVILSALFASGSGSTWTTIPTERCNPATSRNEYIREPRTAAVHETCSVSASGPRYLLQRFVDHTLFKTTKGKLSLGP
jgi:hypothetical protein